MYKKAISHFKNSDPILYEVASNIKPFELSVWPDPFLRLVRTIIGQQLSVKAASTIFSRFEGLFEKNDIKPNGLIKIPDEVLRKCGISYQKISYLKDLARKVRGKKVHLKKLSDMPSEVVVEELIRIKGIGVWTAEMFLMFSLGRPDVFSFGDLGLQNAIKKLYKLKDKPTIKQMEKLSKNWVPFRTYAAIILWQTLDNEPK